MRDILKQSKWVIFAAFITPLLFSVFFARQAYFVFAHDFSVWKGGGMGMFSSPDHPTKRRLYFYTIAENGTEQQIIPEFDPAGHSFYEFSVLPHPKILEEIRHAFFKGPLYLSGEDPERNVLYIVDYEQYPGQPRFNPAKLRIELWKMNHLDSTHNTIHKSKAHEWIIE